MKHIVTAILIALTLAACGDEETTDPGQTLPPAVVSVVVTPASATLVTLWETFQLTASALDANGNTISGKTFTWSSSDESLVMVSLSGEVTAVANGSVTIRATTDGVNGTAAIQVDDPWQDSAAAFLAALTEAHDIASSAETAILESPAIQSLEVLGGMFKLGAPLDEVLGTTFVYNALEATYQPDLSRTDAPADDARFLLYAVADQQVIIPLDEIGYVDLMQTAPPSDRTVSVRAVVRGQTAFSYEATGLVELDSTRVTAMGTIVSATSDIIFDATEQINEDLFTLCHSHNQRLETEKGEVRREIRYFLAKQFSDSDTDITRRVAWVASSVGGLANQTGQQDSTVIESEVGCVYPIIISFNGEEAANISVSAYSIYGREVFGDMQSKLASFERFFFDGCRSFRENRVSNPLLLPAWATFAEVL